MNRSVVKIIFLAIVIVMAFVSVRVFHMDRYLDEEALGLWIAGLGAWGPVFYIAIYSVAPSMMIPGLPLTVIGGILFGPLWGVVYVAIGSTIGASAAFLVARYMGRSWVEGFLKKGGRLARINAEAGKNGWKIVALTRLVPFFPYNFLNYAFGLTRIKFSHYAIATFIFMLPGIVAYVVFSSSIPRLLRGRVTREFVIGICLVAAISLIPLIYKIYRGSKGDGGHGQ